MRKKGRNAAIVIKDPKDLQRIANRMKSYNYPAYILWSIGVNTGYRGGDLVKLTVADVKKAIQTNELVIQEEKTKKTRKVKFERVVKLSNRLIKILQEYIQDKEDAEYLYWSQKGEGVEPFKENISREALGKIFKSVLEEIGILGSIGTHTARKTYGYFQYIERDKDIYYVQRLFGHAKVTTTMEYIGLDEDILQESAKISDKYVF
ncbi:tyrosine-type recombinase/integrase [Clostridium sp. YIM B02569]|uniref:tyrosine-type recombinase/integrase n=1 Tax=Clostridium sp. YIM B02569 TaxID=2911967 RepID=UPI001EECABC5|nr:tyrosine-type recombinase/integrase [Clostridium sp. YIM B02569]